MFAEPDNHYPSRSGQTSLATAVANITKPVTKNNFWPSTGLGKKVPARFRECGRQLQVLLHGTLAPWISRSLYVSSICDPNEVVLRWF